MPVYKDAERGTWYVDLKYKDWQNKLKHHKKRGFKTQKEAKAYERDFLSKAQSNSDMSFKALAEIYIDDLRSRCKVNTTYSAESILKNYILSYFSEFSVSSITPQAVRKWQNELIKKDYSQNLYNILKICIYFI